MTKVDASNRACICFGDVVCAILGDPIRTRRSSKMTGRFGQSATNSGSDDNGESDQAGPDNDAKSNILVLLDFFAN